MSAASGPLNALLRSPGGQYVVLGMGAYTLLAPEKVMELLRPFTDKALIGDAGHQPSFSHAHSPNSVTIIRENSGSNATWTTTIVTYTLGAAGIWVSYTVLSNLLPETVSQLLPVTKRVFDKATKHLATSMFQVKQALEQQLERVLSRQDDLGDKQDQLGHDVKDVQSQLRTVGRDVTSVATSVQYCQEGIDEAERLQSYTARGVKLLVTAVSSILPGDDRITRELMDFNRDGEAFRRQLDGSRHNNNVPPENEHPRLSRQSSLERIVPAQSGVPPQLEGKSVDEILTLIQSGKITVDTAVETTPSSVYGTMTTAH